MLEEMLPIGANIIIFIAQIAVGFGFFLLTIFLLMPKIDKKVLRAISLVGAFIVIGIINYLLSGLGHPIVNFVIIFVLELYAVRKVLDLSWFKSFFFLVVYLIVSLLVVFMLSGLLVHM